MQKLFVLLLAFLGNFLIQWYAHFTGRLPSKGTYLGIAYDSVFVRALVTQFEYLWLLILVNFLYTTAFSIGLGTFKNFFSLMIFWLAMGPVATLVFQIFVLKERVSWVAGVGVALLFIGSVLVMAQKEVAAALTGKF